MLILTVILIAYAVIASPFIYMAYQRFRNRWIKDPEVEDIPWQGLPQMICAIVAVLAGLVWPYLIVRYLPEALRELKKVERAAENRGMSLEQLVEEAKRVSELTSYERWAEENGV